MIDGLIALGRTDKVLVSDQEWGIVTQLLGEVVPGRRVWAFGSRATGKRLKKYSDLDLAVEGKLTWEERARLSEAFDESLLSFKVDVVELEMVEKGFRARVERDFLVVQGMLFD